jgi:hypothetical protein
MYHLVKIHLKIQKSHIYLMHVSLLPICNMNRYTYWNFMDDIGAMPILCLGCLVPKTYNAQWMLAFCFQEYIVHF